MRKLRQRGTFHLAVLKVDLEFNFGSIPSFGKQEKLVVSNNFDGDSHIVTPEGGRYQHINSSNVDRLNGGSIHNAMKYLATRKIGGKERHDPSAHRPPMMCTQPV